MVVASSTCFRMEPVRSGINLVTWQSQCCHRIEKEELFLLCKRSVPTKEAKQQNKIKYARMFKISLASRRIPVLGLQVYLPN